MAAEHGVRTEGLQALSFWEHVVDLLSLTHGSTKTAETRAIPSALEMNPYSTNFNPGKYFAYTRTSAKRVTDLRIAEDNEAVIKITKKARSMALRHLPRTHRIDVHWLFEVCADAHVCMRYTNTKQQVADLMTKALNSPDTWHHLLDIAQIRSGLTSKTAETLVAPVVGTAMPIASAECRTCGFNITSSSDCPCTWP